jgi:CheY-like chemotaxis protein
LAKPKILIVDDEPDVVTLIERTLETEGFESVAAYDGISALDIAEAEEPAVILLDIMMPMMSGYEVCEQLKANPQTQGIPIICVTSAHSTEAFARCRQVGANALLTKPFSPAELIAQIQRQLARLEERDTP